METDNRRPNAALINREWFEAARSIMSVQDLGIVLVRACEYVFGSETFDVGGDVQKAVFAMIKPALDSDIAKYNERCARNAANARSQRQRVAASGSEWQRVEANTTTTTTPTPTTTSTTTPSLSPAEDEERERWLIFGYFWSIGSCAIKEELSAFWSYYESLGWKNNKGAQIVSKLAAARMWKRQYESKPAPNGADAWYKAVQECPINDYSVFMAFMGAERVEGAAVVRLKVGEQWERDFKDQCAGVLPTLARLWRVPEVRIERI